MHRFDSDDELSSFDSFCSCLSILGPFSGILNGGFFSSTGLLYPESELNEANSLSYLTFFALTIKSSPLISVKKEHFGDVTACSTQGSSSGSQQCSPTSHLKQITRSPLPKMSNLDYQVHWKARHVLSIYPSRKILPRTSLLA